MAHASYKTTADRVIQAFGIEMPKGRNELTALKMIAELGEAANGGLADLYLTLAILMDVSPTASTARQLRETILAISAPAVVEKQVKNDINKLIEVMSHS